MIFASEKLKQAIDNGNKHPEQLKNILEQHEAHLIEYQIAISNHTYNLFYYAWYWCDKPAFQTLVGMLGHEKTYQLAFSNTDLSEIEKILKWSIRETSVHFVTFLLNTLHQHSPEQLAQLVSQLCFFAAREGQPGTLGAILSLSNQTSACFIYNFSGLYPDKNKIFILKQHSSGRTYQDYLVYCKDIKEMLSAAFLNEHSAPDEIALLIENESMSVDINQLLKSLFKEKKILKPQQEIILDKLQNAIQHAIPLFLEKLAHPEDNKALTEQQIALCIQEKNIFLEYLLNKYNDCDVLRRAVTPSGGQLYRIIMTPQHSYQAFGLFDKRKTTISLLMQKWKQASLAKQQQDKDLNLELGF